MTDKGGREFTVLALDVRVKHLVPALGLLDLGEQVAKMDPSNCFVECPMPARILSLSTPKPAPGPNEYNLEALKVLREKGMTLGQRAMALSGRRPAAVVPTDELETEPRIAPRGP